MSRMVDEPYFTYSTYSALTSGIQVKCPKCNRAGVVTADDENAYFRCLSCLSLLWDDHVGRGTQDGGGFLLCR